MRYTLAGLDPLPHWLGWSLQVPAPRAAERNEAQIAAWRQKTWARNNRAAADLGAWLVSQGESARSPGRRRVVPEASEATLRW
jgi:hypothetical protein